MFNRYVKYNEKSPGLSEINSAAVIISEQISGFPQFPFY